MTERYIPRGKDGQLRKVWDPENPTTSLEHAWNSMPQIGKDYFQADWRLRDPNLTIQERSVISLQLFELFDQITKLPMALDSVIKFIEMRDRK